MKVLALETDVQGVSALEFEPYLEAEAAAVWKLLQSGVCREIYFREGPSQAVLILEVDGTAEAEAALARLPLVAAGLIEFEVIGLRPYPGLGRLFRDRPPEEFRRLERPVGS